MKSLFNARARTLEQHINDTARDDTPPVVSDELFVLADYDESRAEQTGYSNYSYWRSTLQAFLHNRTAVAMLIVLVVLLAFTFIQPLLPGQYGANTINNDPVTGIQLQNQSPSLTTVYTRVPEGTSLTGQKLDDNWYTVSNVLSSIKARQAFTIVEYGEEWCRIDYKGQTGYIAFRDQSNDQYNMLIDNVRICIGSTVVDNATSPCTISMISGIVSETRG